MMAVHIGKASDISSREHVQCLYNENVEAESKRRRSVQARIPFDSNLWQKMRENFVAIILEDHAFAEKHEIEFALWQLHYGRIEELRSHYNVAIASANGSPGQGGKTGPGHPDRVEKIRSQFKAFLSEATGFYHDLMLKIRAKYGLSLGYLSDDPETEVVLLSNDETKFMKLKKGLISCHRCLIYLGDLARYRGLYGEAELKVRDFTAASSYYMQASSFWPSSGNPHHQLAILASYSGDEFVAIYRYFRSLGVENPFTMARDNLIIAFEKNRQSYSQLMEDSRIVATRRVSGRKGRGKAEARFSSKDHKIEASPVKEKTPTFDILKAFSVKFVRLHGILFTRTSLETFEDVLSIAKIEFLELLSAHTEEHPKFGLDSAESSLYIVRLVAILIFSAHNANRDSEDQSYTEVLQRNVLLQNAYTAAYEIMGHVFERCVTLHDIFSSSLLPGITVFIEWLACHPEVAKAGEEEELGVRSVFWSNCIPFLNRILSTGLTSEDEDETFFSNTSRYEEGETTNHQALPEDFELRGFLPLHLAQQILNFSRKNSIGKDGGYKEKKTRIQRIVAAAKALASVVRVGQRVVYFDQSLKKFIIGLEPHVSCDVAFSNPEMTMPNDIEHDMPTVKESSPRVLTPASQVFNGEDEEEEIVFKPPVADKHDGGVAVMSSGQILDSVSSMPVHSMGSYVESISAFPDGALAHDGFINSSTAPPASLSTGAAPHPSYAVPNSSKWLLQQEASVMNELMNFSLFENGHCEIQKPKGQFCESKHGPCSSPLPQPLKLSASNTHPLVPTAHGTVLPSKSQATIISTSTCDVASINSIQVLPVGVKKNEVLRQNGPPPGFIPNYFDESHLGLSAKDDIPLIDDYSWLDGYQMPSPTPISGSKTSNLASQAYNNSNACKRSSMGGMVAFPFPGKLASAFQVPPENSKGWKAFQFPQPMNMFQQQPMQKGNQHSMFLPGECRGQSPWEGSFLV